METFEFNAQWLPQSMIDIDNPGNFALEAQDEFGVFWFLIIRTILGNSEILSFGPIDIDSDEPLSGYCCTYDKDEYNQKQLKKTINLWLNDKGKKLTDANVIEIYEALSHLPNMQQFMISSVSDLLQGE